MKKLFEKLLKLFKKEQITEEKKSKVSEYLKKHDKHKTYIIEFLKEQFSVYMCDYVVFKGVYGLDSREEGFEYSLRNNSSGPVITILDEGSIFVRVDTIFRKTYKLVERICDSHDIVDSETPAYMFGYLIENILKDFIGIQGLRELLKNVDPQKEITGESYGIKYTLLSTKGKDWGYTTNGEVESKVGKKIQILRIPRKKTNSIYRDINTWAHELYHMTENTIGILSRKNYAWDVDILVNYVHESLSILKYNLKGKL